MGSCVPSPQEDAHIWVLLSISGRILWSPGQEFFTLKCNFSWKGLLKMRLCLLKHSFLEGGGQKVIIQYQLEWKLKSTQKQKCKLSWSCRQTSVRNQKARIIFLWKHKQQKFCFTSFNYVSLFNYLPYRFLNFLDAILCMKI